MELSGWLARCLAFTCLLVVSVSANTEIIVFDTTRPALEALPTLPANASTSQSDILSLNSPVAGRASWNQGKDSLHRSSKKHWYRLNTFQESIYGRKVSLPPYLATLAGLSRRTVRFSWPASTPAEVNLVLYREPSQHATWLLVDIRQENTIQVPSLGLEHARHPDIVYELLIEPVYFAFVPSTALPLLGMLIALLTVLIVARVPQRLYWLAEQTLTDDKKQR